MRFIAIRFRTIDNVFRGSRGHFSCGNRNSHLLACRDLKVKRCAYDSFSSRKTFLGVRVCAGVPRVNSHVQLLDEISFDDTRLRKHLDTVLQEFNFAKERHQTARDHEKDKWNLILHKFQRLVSLIQELEEIRVAIKDLVILSSDLEKQNEKDLLAIARQDIEAAESNLEMCKEKILLSVVPLDNVDDRDIVVELSAGVGGQEAMLFVKDLYQMYCNFADFKGWTWEVLRYDDTGIGGLRHAHLSINGLGAYRTLKLESGVHRVQRVPKTERSGRMHTSTATVAVLPQPSDIDIMIQPQDLLLEFKRSSGAGGQNVNRRDTCVRITHVPTGIAVESQMERCQHQNRALALKSLRAKLYQRELETVTQSTEQSRKTQVGTAGRAEKVRTYNFTQNRITDHRLQRSLYDVDSFLQGQEKLNEFTESLQRWLYVQSVHELLRKYN